jgi:hypothetical protein
MVLAFDWNWHIYNEDSCHSKGTLWHFAEAKMRGRTKSGQTEKVLVLLTHPPLVLDLAQVSVTLKIALPLIASGHG